MKTALVAATVAIVSATGLAGSAHALGIAPDTLHDTATSVLAVDRDHIQIDCLTCRPPHEDSGHVVALGIDLQGWLDELRSWQGHRTLELVVPERDCRVTMCTDIWEGDDTPPADLICDDDLCMPAWAWPYAGEPRRIEPEWIVPYPLIPERVQPLLPDLR